MNRASSQVGLIEPHYSLENEFPLRLRCARFLARQKWITKGKDRIQRLLCDPGGNHNYLFEVEFFGKRYRGNLGQYIDWMVFCHGASAPAELGLLRAAAGFLRKQKLGPISFFDIGANVGHHSLFMAGDADRVIAFEPFPKLQALIREKIVLNQLKNVEIIPFALGEQDAELTYYPGLGANSGEGTFVGQSAPQSEVSCVLSVRRGDRLFDAMQLPPVDLMKVDVEGFEPFVFKGLRERILRDRPIILTEFLDLTRSMFASEADLRQCFYDEAIFVNVEGRWLDFKLCPFKYETNGEILIVPPEMSEFVTSRLSGDRAA